MMLLTTFYGGLLVSCNEILTVMLNCSCFWIQSLKLLSVMAAVRLDDDADSIENTLSLALVDPKSGAAASRGISADPLASSSWDEVYIFSF